MDIYTCRYLKRISQEKFNNAANEVKCIVDAATSTNGIGELFSSEFSDDVMRFCMLEQLDKGWVSWIARFEIYRDPQKRVNALFKECEEDNVVIAATAHQTKGVLLLDTLVRVLDKETGGALHWLPTIGIIAHLVDFPGFRVRDPRLKKSSAKKESVKWQ